MYIYHKLAILFWSALLMLSNSLKCYVQTGLSLESLGKGAVQFSQKFTFQELKDRWHSLASHASVFVEASPHVVDSVDSSSTPSPETHILEYKVQKSVQRKRMNEGVQDCYNPMLKRVKSSVIEIGSPLSTDHGEATKNHFECVVSNCESVHQHMPNLETFSASAATVINVTESCNSIAACLDCDLHKFEGDSHSVAKKSVQPRGVLKLNDSCCCEAEIPVKSDQMGITSAESDFSSSTVTRSPAWNTSQSISEATLPEVFQVEVKERNAVNFADFSNNCDANNSEFLGYDVDSGPVDPSPCHNLENSAPNTDGNFARSSASCVDLKELEDFLFTDIDGTDIDDITDLDSFLSDFTWGKNIADVKDSSLLGGGACPGDLVKEGQNLVCSSEAPLLPFIPAAHPELPTCVSDPLMLPFVPDEDNSELKKSCAPEAQSSPTAPSANPELPMSCVPNTQILPSTPNADPDLPELCNGIICCVLNTEDTEIPCNDNARLKLTSQPLSSSSRKNGQVTGSTTMNTAENEEKPRPPESIQSQILSDLGLNLPFITRGD